jgi:hypothetical protein
MWNKKLSIFQESNCLWPEREELGTDVVCDLRHFCIKPQFNVTLTLLNKHLSASLSDPSNGVKHFTKLRSSLI